MLSTLATVKDFLQWLMVALTVALVEIARREWMRAEHVRSESLRGQGAGVDFGGERRQLDLKGGPVEMSTMQISGPRFIPPEELQPAPKPMPGRNGSGGPADEPGPPVPRQPEGPGVPDKQNSDNYYGNGMKTGLSRKPTLNYMYESRI